MDAVFCGNGTLLIQCAEIFRQAGGSLRAVLTGDAQIIAWAEAEGLRHLGRPEAPDLGDLQFDYLFSVANLTVLPQALIVRAARMAINFHDGPLPARAGLNVPVWAIIDGVQTHAVTWHEMLAAVDTGRALKVRSFEVRDTDTAFSLNASCYEAGLESFRDLLTELQAGSEAPMPLSGPRGWYGRAKRPDALATLDFGHTMAGLDRLMRALDFGGYANPLAVPKLWTGQAVLAVTRLEMRPDAQGPAGQILGVDEAGIVVGVADGAVRLAGLMDMAGKPVDIAAFRVGQMLPAAPATDTQTIGKSEPAWEATLLTATAAIPPYPMDHGRDNSTGQGAHYAAFNAGAAGQDTLLAAYLAWVCGLTGQSQATLALQDAAPAAPYLSPLRPVTLTVDAAATPRALTSAFAANKAAALARAPMAADLGLRIVHPETRAQALRALSVVYAGAIADDAHALGAADLAIALDPPRFVAAAGSRYAPATLQAMAQAFGAYLAAFIAKPDTALADLPLGAGSALTGPNQPIPALRVPDALATITAKTPDAPALEAGATRLSYAELDARATALAGALQMRGAGPGKIVGLCLERSADLIIAMLAILKTGAAYLPLDPAYPVDRLSYMIDDAGAPLIVASRKAAAHLGLAASRVVFPDATGPLPAGSPGSPDDLAYLIYTSGSTGKPKGVMIPHRAVINFFAGMDAAVPLAPGARLLAVTSVSFDISVLEILWVLSRGATLVLQVEDAAGTMPDFSLFYFASEAAGTGHHAYRLLLEGAKFADTNGFAAIWTPERHFHAFGGLYPNPAISSAALAGITKNVKLRAGSSVAPLHHPVQVAEDWALVDNLSNGRAGMAIASGWQPNDFILRPDAFAKRKDIMLETVDTMRRLWAGESLPFPGHDGKPVMTEIFPKPMQKPIPLWLTAAGNPETFAAAARLGCGVLTHLLGQTFEEVAEKIAAYRTAWRSAGHAGQGHVVLMLHTFVGQDEEQVRAAARGPMKGYLKSAVDLVRRAAWTFPTIVNRADSAGVTPQEMFEKEALSPEDLDQLLDHAFERYYQTSGLFGTPDSAKDIVRRVTEIGVDEIACLIDFGIDTDLVLENLPNIKSLMDGLQAEGGISRKVSVADDVVMRAITHLQCTPSMATFLPGTPALAQLDCLMVGGEAFPPDLAADIRKSLKGRLLNMYGPTETTIWSSVARLDVVEGKIPLGAPIANTTLSVRSPDGRALPDLVEGELWIGGAGMADGYWQRPDLTAERFVMDGATRFYRTGDLVRAQPGGTLEFLGRIDNQVKIRGHRIELGEIEAALLGAPGITAGVVHPVTFGPGDVRLVGYVTGKGADPAALRTKLAETLPEIMVPSQIVLLDRMPLTPNGKIDRKALPKPMAEITADVVVAAEGLETTIAGIWATALGVKTVSTTANFFDLGGHSLLVVQVQRQMRDALARDIAITDIFRFPTVRALAAHLGEAADEGQPDAASRGAARAAARLARMGRR